MKGNKDKASVELAEEQEFFAYLKSGGAVVYDFGDHNGTAKDALNQFGEICDVLTASGVTEPVIERIWDGEKWREEDVEVS